MIADNPPNPKKAAIHTDVHFRNRVLEMLVHGAPLIQILEALLQGFEALQPGALCSVMLLDAPGKTFAQAIGPSLPGSYTAALIGLAIGPAVGSCGTAAYSAERVVVEDISTHPFWAPYKHLAAEAGVAACWSQPIVAASGKVLGTFAIYYRKQRAPDAVDLELIQQSASLACVAIEKDAEAQKLRDSEERYRTLVELSPDPVLVHRLGTILYVNPSAIKAFGAQQASELVGQQTHALIHPDYRQQQQARMQALVNAAPMAAMTESRFLRIDGTPFDVEVQGTSIMYQGSPAIHVVLRDITQRKQAQAALQESQERFRALVEFLPTAVIVHQELKVVYANPAAVSILGATDEQALMGHSIMELTHPDYRQQVAQRLKARETDGAKLPAVELKLIRCDGAVIDVQMSGARIRYGGGMAVQASFNDITPLKTYQRQLESMAHFDALTQLPNRQLLQDRLHQAMSQTQRRRLALAVVFVDLDGFKAVNDRHGHGVGDSLLVVLAQRMKGALRDGDTLARIGGDEFVAVLVDLNQSEDADPVLERLLQAAADPVRVGDDVLRVSASMGIALFPRDGTHADLLLRRADQSMYLAKQAGRNRYQYFGAPESAAPQTGDNSNQDTTDRQA
jgi:diguanylate cyclase (GGDEF)-like protein/PAS domain S-box-containing protein